MNSLLTPVDSLITTASTNDGTDGDIQFQPATESEGLVTELRVPTISEAATDPRPVLRPREPTDIGLIIGIMIIIIVVITAVVTVIIIMAVLFKRRGEMVLDKKRALSNPVYSSNGQSTTYCTVHYLLIQFHVY